LCDQFFLASGTPLGILETGLVQVGVQFFKAVHLGDGREEVALGASNVVLHTPFLMRLGGCAVVALAQVVAAKCAPSNL